MRERGGIITWLATAIALFLLFGTGLLPIIPGLSAPGQRVLAEVKGVTLERDGVAAFPDAPTLRGLRHVRELTAAAARGYGAAVVFLLQMEGMNVFTPNDEAQPEFRPALAQARQAGVAVQAWESHVTPDGITLAGRIPVDI